MHNTELLMIYTSHYYSGDLIKQDEMGMACDMYGREQKCIQGFGRKT